MKVMTDLQFARLCSTIQIHSKNPNTLTPSGIGSGCFVYYKDKKLFLTVQHNLKREDSIHYIAVDFNSEKKRMDLQPIDMSFFAVGKMLNNNKVFDFREVEIVDFALMKMEDFLPCKLVFFWDSGEIRRFDCYALKLDLDITPDSSTEYGFAGYIMPQLMSLVGTQLYKENGIENGFLLEPVSYDKLKYLRSEGNYHVFALPNNNYSHVNFKGTSGAPITDNEGNIVSLVAHGPEDYEIVANPNEWLIYGINLSKFKTEIDIECDDI